MKRHPFLLLAAIPLLMATGCPTRKFKVEMTRTPGGHHQRTLTIWTEEDGQDSGPSEEALAAARAAYGTSGAEQEQRVRFEGEFADSLPADLMHEKLANHGLITSVTTRMGAVVTYVERMPGHGNPAELLRGAERLTDMFVRSLVAGFSQVPELAAEPERLEGVKRFLESAFEEDCISALLLGWHTIVRLDFAQTSAGGREDEPSVMEPLFAEELARFVSFAVQRGYLDRSRVILDDDALSAALADGFVRRVAKAAGYARSEPLPAYLAALSEGHQLETLHEKGLERIGISSDEFAEAWRTLLPAFFSNNAEGEVVFNTAQTPRKTNGEYDQEKRTLSWNCRARQGCEPPQILYATWAEPDCGFQRTHLGQVMIEGERLSDYISWLTSLSAAHRREWDAMVTTLNPDQRDSRLTGFRFSDAGASQDGEDLQEAMTRGAQLILQRE